jgi:DNA-binding CsgD family transcriptional regulator
MGVRLVGQPQGGGGPSAHVLLLDALDEVLVVVGHPPSPGPGLVALCRMLARLVDAPAAGHARFDIADGYSRLTVWQRQGATSLDVDEPPTDVSSPHDWWTISTARRRLLDCLDQRHLAELPLNPDPRRRSVLVVGREVPFTDTDTERMATTYRSLAVLERVVDGLYPGKPTPLAAPGQRPPPRPADLTAREHAVLTMLGEGLLARSIAQRLEVSERTVHKHLGNVYRKLDVHDRLLAVRRAEMLGLLPAVAAARW